MTPIQWGPSPPEPNSYSATSTGTPAPLSPDVAELASMSGARLRAACGKLVTEYRAEIERIDDQNCELQKEVAEYKRTCERLAELEQRYAQQFLNMQDDLDRLAAENAKLRAVAEKLLLHFPDLPEILGQSEFEATELIAAARAALKETA